MIEHSRNPKLVLIEQSDLCSPQAAALLEGNYAALSAISAWARSYLCEPNPQLGRQGPVCPYVPTALQQDLFYLAVCRGGDLTAEQVEGLLSAYREWFLELPPTTGNRTIFKTILCLFPDLEPGQWRGVIEATQEKLRRSYVQQGLMIGEFHAGPPEKAGLWNQEFRPLASPVPMLVIRHMVPTDYVFLRGERALMEPYLQRFQGTIPAHLRLDVAEAAAQHGLAFPHPRQLENVHPRVRTALLSEGVPFVAHRHQDQSIEIRSPQDFASALGIEIAQICKSLFLRSRDHRYAVVVCSVLRKVDMARVAVGLGWGRLELATTEELTAMLGFSPGGVSPIGADMPVLVDRDLLDQPTVLIAAGERAVEIELSPRDLVRLTKATVLPLTFALQTAAGAVPELAAHQEV